MIVEAQSRGVSEQACLIAALLGERDIIASEMFKKERGTVSAEVVGPSDLLHRLDLFDEAAATGFAPARMREMGLDPGAVLAVDRVRRQLLRSSGEDRSGRMTALPDEEQALLISILAGYPDRVAKRRLMKAGNTDLLLSSGGSALLSASSVAQKHEFLVAIDAEQRRGTGANKSPITIVRMASAIEPEWLIDLFAGDLRETTEAQWNVPAERVEVVKRLLYDQLVIDESKAKDVSGPEVTKVLSGAALAAGLQKFVDLDELNQFIARVELIANTFSEAGIPALTDDDIRHALVALCDGLSSFAELRESASHGRLIEMLRRKLSVEQSRLLAQMAPEFVAIAGRRRVRVNYESRKPPWIESRLQDFFGMAEGPKIAGGRVALVLHLLAPNRRPVQVTTDLEGFWKRTYPQVRRELSRRYPKHPWPENP
jgi:ATP-dependent helicase HrpB